MGKLAAKCQAESREWSTYLQRNFHLPSKGTSSHLTFRCFIGMGFVLLLWVLGSVGLGGQSVEHKEDTPINLLKQALLCSCLSLSSLGRAREHLPKTTAQTRGRWTDVGPGCCF